MMRIFKTLNLVGLFTLMVTPVQAFDFGQRPSLGAVTSYNYNQSGSYSSRGGGNIYGGWEANAFEEKQSQSDFFGRSGSHTVGHSFSIGINPGLVGGFGGGGGGYGALPNRSPYGGGGSLRGYSGGGGYAGGDVYDHGYAARTGGTIARPDPYAAARVGAGPTARMSCRLQTSPAGYKQRACTGPNDGSYVVPEHDRVCWRQNAAALTMDGDENSLLTALGPQKLLYLCKDYLPGSVDVEPVDGGTYLKIVFTSPKLVPLTPEKPGRKAAKTLIAKD